MPGDLTTAFDDGLNALLHGDNIAAICARQPLLAAELRPLLTAAEAVRQLGATAYVPRGAQAASRGQFLGRAAALAAQRRSPRLRAFAWLHGLALAPRAAMLALSLAALLLVGGYSAVTVSATSLPGEPLYGLKRALERTVLQLAPGPDARAQLEASFAERRFDEVQRLTAAARTATVEFGGRIESMAAARWSVDGLAVTVGPETEVIGAPVVGLYVQVVGASQPDGTILAARVEVTGVALSGRVRQQSEGVWSVDDITVRVSAATNVVGSPTIGDDVAVQARRLPDGQLLALEIRLTGSGSEPRPTTTAVATATNNLAGTSAAPTPTALPAETLAGTAAPAATATPNPTDQASEVRFTGVVQAIGAQTWQIGGATVKIVSATEIRDDPQVGQTVEVRALRAADGALTALRIELQSEGPSPSNTPDPDGEEAETAEPTHTPGGGGGPGPSASNTPDPAETQGSGGDEDEVRFDGTLEAINGNVWVISGQPVTVNGATEIRDNPQVGDEVEVRALPQGDGTLIALRIEKKD